MQNADNWQPPADLQAFLDAGPPPVYVGFGSMNNRDPQGTADLVISALQRAGQRGILHAGWDGLRPVTVPDHIHFVDSVPHDWLFPRMAAVVHHGGAGTTAAGLRAGVPSLLVPFFADQPFWAQQVSRLGCAPPAIPRQKLTVDGLAQGIKTAVSDLHIKQRAAEIGEIIRAENGVEQAVALIAPLVAAHPMTPNMG